MDTTLHQQWLNEGYVLIAEIFDQEFASKLKEICESILGQWRARNPETGEPEESESVHVMRHLNRPEYYREHPESLPVLMDAITHTKVLNTARTILGEEPMFRCTSLFFNPKSGQLDGNWHRDTQFTTETDDEEKAKIEKHNHKSIQVQVALVPTEDIEVVPKSHLRWDNDEEYSIRKADGGDNNRSNDMPGSLRVKQQPGDAVMFNPCALHRGRYHADKLRRTLMLTYTAASSASESDYFNCQPWFLDDGYLDALSSETRSFFEPFVERYKETWI